VQEDKSAQHRQQRWLRGAVARLFFLASLAGLLHASVLTAFAWYAASQRLLEVIEPWMHHWDLSFYLAESSEKLAWAAVAAASAIAVKPNRSSVALLVVCILAWLVLAWLVHFLVHFGLVT